MAVVVVPSHAVPPVVEEAGKTGRSFNRHYIIRIPGDRGSRIGP